jgi:hypothetical protein
VMSEKGLVPKSERGAMGQLCLGKPNIGEGLVGEKATLF